jgi:hypothetical protein
LKRKGLETIIINDKEASQVVVIPLIREGLSRGEKALTRQRRNPAGMMIFILTLSKRQAT